MGFRFRKSFGKGPFKVTFSKSGISTSFGGKGARITKKANGNTMTTLSVPGTGISYVSETSKKKNAKKEKRTMKKQHKEKKPLYKRWWVWALVGIGALGAIGSEEEITTTPPTTETTTAIVETITTPPSAESTTFMIPTTTIPTTQRKPTTTKQPQIIYFYVTEHGTKYHRASCRHIKNSDVIKISQETAKRNYEPCRTCHP